jgi:hypothetical protein
MTSSIPASTAVCVLGMHRSGTSVVARLLNLLGVYLGPERSISRVGHDNPSGYWEHHPITLLNDEILARFGGRWDAPAAFPPGWLTAPGMAELREKGRELLTDFAGRDLWGWKDPRTCLTLPFWRDLVEPTHYLVALRNPGEVVASLERRNGMSAATAERLWLAHVHASLTHTSGQTRMFVFYEDIMLDPAAELDRMAGFIGRLEAREDPSTRAALAAFVEERFCHHRVSLEELADDHRISFAAKSLYLAARGLAPRDTSGQAAAGWRRTTPAIDRALDVIGARAVETWDRAAESAVERDVLARSNQHLTDSVARLSGAVEHLNGRIADLHGRVDDLNGTIEQRNGAVEHLNGTVANLTASLATLALERDSLESDQQLLALDRDRLAGELDARIRMLDEIHGSAAWRTVTRLWRVLVRLFPEGSRRRRLFDTLVRHIAGGPGQGPAPGSPSTSGLPRVS